MSDVVAKSDPYNKDNHRFRKAYIRERLATLKVERELLVAEREKIDDALGVKKSGKKSAEEDQDNNENVH